MVGAGEGGVAWVARLAVAAVVAEEGEKEAMAEGEAGKVVTADVAVEMAVMAAGVGATAGEVGRYWSATSRHREPLVTFSWRGRYVWAYQWVGNEVTAV